MQTTHSKSHFSICVHPVGILLTLVTILCLLIVSCGSDSSTESNQPAAAIDVDGNVYKTVKIGDQIWMAENLKVTHYRSGEPIPHPSASSWDLLTTGAYGNYGNDTALGEYFGRIYNGYALTDARGVAPQGWHIPSLQEWQELIDFLGGDSVAGGKLKETGTEHWTSPNAGATNASGFTALPGGAWVQVPDRNIGFSGNFWTSTRGTGDSAWGFRVVYSDSAAHFEVCVKKGGMSIRCVKD
ncbi:MAG TPA: fibrobacter succinogenes major paralogous domain-containing protein [candidate division Zixibacteria bacterium]|nr:fibrobacter succinogenes major paralogous domain-containing protein [candidate division Zixibacteria bacterium]